MEKELLQSNILPGNGSSASRIKKNCLEDDFIFNHAPIGIFYFTPNLHITKLNNRFCEYLGSSKDQLLHLNMNNINDKNVLPAITDALKGNNGYYEGYYKTTFSNQKIYILLQTSPIYNSTNEIIGGMGIIQNISERKNFEDALIESEKKYRHLIENLNDIFFTINAHGNIVFINQAIEKTTGLSSNIIIGKHYRRFFNPTSNKSLYRALNNLKDGDEYITELKIITKSKEIKWFRTSIKGVTDNNNQLTINGKAQDITDIRIAQEQITENEERFRLLAMSTNDILFEWDIQNDEIEWYGDSLKTLLNENKPNNISQVLKLIHPNDSRNVFEIWKNAIIHKKTWKTTFRWIRPDGKIFHISSSGAVLYRKNKPIKVLGALTDITNETELIENLKIQKQIAEENQAKTKGILSAIPDMMFVFDSSGKIIDFHAHSKKDLYITPNIFINKWIREVLPSHVADLTMQKIITVLSTKKAVQYEYNLEINGVQQDFESRMVFLNENKTLAIVRNITDAKNAEKELIHSKIKAEESDRLKSAFLANMSHEIRTPMNAIIGFAQLINMPDILENERKHYSSIILKSGQHLLNIINDVLEISKIETNQTKIHIDKIDLNEFLRELYELFNITFFAGRNDLNLTTPSIKPFYIHSDSQKLHQIMSNLLSNASKFCNNKKVIFGYKPFADKVEIFVEDNGIGIPKEEQQKIFERFIQASSNEKCKSGGTGLGLSISKSLIELMNGTISLISDPGKGSKFTITLPINFNNAT